MANIPGQQGTWQRQGGQYQYINKKGEAVRGSGDHMVNILTGETMTIRQFQNRQHEAKEQQGIPTPPRQPRRKEGLYLTRRSKGTEKLAETHGNMIWLYFRDMQQAHDWFKSLPPDSPYLRNYGIWVAQARYSSRNQVMFNKSDPKGRRKRGFITLSDRYYSTQTQYQSEIPWLQAQERIDIGEIEVDAIILFGAER